MTHVRGHFRDWRGKRIWIPDHTDKRAEAEAPPPPAPKQIKIDKIVPAKAGLPEAPKPKADSVISTLAYRLHGLNLEKPSHSVKARIEAVQGFMELYKADPAKAKAKVASAIKKAPTFLGQSASSAERVDAAVAYLVLGDKAMHTGKSSAARWVWTAIGMSAGPNAGGQAPKKPLQVIHHPAPKPKPKDASWEDYGAPPPKKEKDGKWGGWGSWKDWKPSKPVYPNAITHPKKKDDGSDFQIDEPSKGTGEDTWADPTAMATFIPGGKAPAELNGTPLTPWTDAPTTPDEWDEVDGQDFYLDEPIFEPTKAPAAGVIVEEPDGRVWIIHPSNGFGGYKRTFPKGHQDDDMVSLQASAIKEAYEEAGLRVEITGFLMDVERTTTTTRYYTARRVGGTPTDCGWESQAVSLVPKSMLYSILPSWKDYKLCEAIGAGPAPEPPKPPPLPPMPMNPHSGGHSALFADTDSWG